MPIEISLYDPKNINVIDQWLTDNCHSTIRWEVIDLSDVSVFNDEVMVVTFGKGDDAILFVLRWNSENKLTSTMV